MKHTGTTVLATLFLFLGTHQVMASGYEKNIMWGGRSGGEAGIASPWIQGADAIYFNPAGLAGGKAGKSVSLNVSPTWSQFSGPVNFNNDSATSSQALTFPAAINYAQSINERFGVGVGYYGSGGAKAVYENVDMLSGRTANVKTDLAVSEIALGGAWILNDRLTIGAALRYVMGKADFAFVQPATASGNVYLNLGLSGMTGASWAARFGAQFKASERTRYSFVYRSEAAINASGKYSGFGQGPVNRQDFAANPVTAHTVLPMAATFGAQHDYERWRALFEYVWTQYSRVGELTADGATSVTLTGVGTVAVNGVNAQLSWRDMHALRFGGEFLGYDWPVRFGYIYTTQVTDKSYARANLVPPGPAHTLTFGTGKDFACNLTKGAAVGSDKPLSFNTAVEYTYVSADSEGLAAGTALSNGGYTRSGTYKVSAYAVHLGLNYTF